MNAADMVQDYRFSDHAEHRFRELETQFPQRSSLVLWALHLVMEDLGFIPRSAVPYVARRVGVTPAWVAGVVTFYTMFREAPIGRFNIQICVNAACWMHGSDHLEDCVREKLGLEPGDTSPDGRFTFTRQTECLAACGNAPAVAINEEFFENLTTEKLATIIDEISGSDTGKFQDINHVLDKVAAKYGEVLS